MKRRHFLAVASAVFVSGRLNAEDRRRGKRPCEFRPYPHEPIALTNGEVPLRLFDAQKDEEKTVATVFTLGTVEPSVLRLDPHPAWNRDGKKACFNGAPDGRRQLFIADLSGMVV